MRLENSFSVPVGVDEAWAALTDPATVAPCFPGATLDSAEGDDFAGSVRVKLGPVSLLYKGKGTFVERDEAGHRVVIKGSGRDSRGNGTAKVAVTSTLRPDSERSTTVDVVTELTVTGRPAQLGRGLLSDVSDKLVGQFAGSLASQLAAVHETAARAEQPEAGPVSDEVQGLDLLGTVGLPVAKRAAPLLVVLAMLYFVLRRRTRRAEAK